MIQCLKEARRAGLLLAFVLSQVLGTCELPRAGRAWDGAAFRARAACSSAAVVPAVPSFHDLRLTCTLFPYSRVYLCTPYLYTSPKFSVTAHIRPFADRTVSAQLTMQQNKTITRQEVQHAQRASPQLMPALSTV